MMETKADLLVIEDTDGLGYLIRTDRGKPVFGPLELAATYSSPTAVKNAVSRIKEDFEVRYMRVRLEVLGRM
jgi:hypothetical protein